MTDPNRTPAAEPTEQMVTVTIAMHNSFHGDLVSRARARNTVATELMRQAVVLDEVLHDHAAHGGEILIREPGEPDRQLILLDSIPL